MKLCERCKKNEAINRVITKGAIKIICDDCLGKIIDRHILRNKREGIK